jgi:hypothetical protein
MDFCPRCGWKRDIKVNAWAEIRVRGDELYELVVNGEPSGAFNSEAEARRMALLLTGAEPSSLGEQK